ncbi:hypothetical protein ACFV46_00535 [Streptomyces sp. NPDC059852]|uniref:hypothetical protein n=1 Tax=Streptomyces sp. NPDC059852 TaxID=3346972 RepID=UPI0036583874
MSLDVAGLVRTRARHPQAVAEAAAYRIRRPLLGGSGRLPTVCGLVAGPSLLHPSDGDVTVAVDIAVGLL